MSFLRIKLGKKDTEFGNKKKIYFYINNMYTIE